MSDNFILEFRDISKMFPGVRALDHVSVGIQRAEVHAIVGENGAGKSTLMKIAAGLYQPDGGQVILNGLPVEIKNAGEALSLGIAMIPQELNLVPEMTVTENILLGIEPRNALGVVDRNEAQRRASDILASLNVTIDPGQRV